MNHSDVQYVPIKTLMNNPDNPRFIRDERFRQMVQSLRDCPEMFKVRPILCSDRTGKLVVLGGNMRLRAAKELKYEKVPVIVLHGLDEKQEREYVIRDNGQFGEWDYDLLSSWDDLPLDDLGVNLPGDWLIDEQEEDNDTGTKKGSSIVLKFSQNQYDRYIRYRHTRNSEDDTAIIWSLLEKIC